MRKVKIQRLDMSGPPLGGGSNHVAAGCAAADAGSSRHSSWTYYLTSAEQLQLARVATIGEPARKVAAIVDATHKNWRRLILMFGGALVALLTGFVLISFAGSQALQYLGLTLFLGAFVVILVVASTAVRTPQREGVVIDRLLLAIREMEKPEVRVDRVATALETAASILFVQFSAAPLGRRGPRRLRRQRMGAAQRAAAAVTSYIGLLDRDEPDYQIIADDMRRAILRVAVGRWQQVAELDRAPGESWVPSRTAELRQWIRSVFQQDTASKVVVALISLAAAIVALVAVVLRVTIGG